MTWSFRIKEQADGSLLYEVSHPAYPESTIRGYTARPRKELEKNLSKTIKRLNAESRDEAMPFCLNKD